MKQLDDYYLKNAEEYFRQTLKVDMGPLHSRFMRHMPESGSVLDAGCGSGRDAKIFMSYGFKVSAFDASPALAHLAAGYLLQPVDVLRFQELAYDKEFDGIWACATLLHVPHSQLPDVFRRLGRALKPDGVLYASFKYGSGEHVRDGRLFTDMNEADLDVLLQQVNGFSEIETWVTEDRRPGRYDEQWLNALLRNEGDAWRNA